MNVSILTATLPERADMLAEAVASVQAQTLAPVEHLIAVDHHREGAGPVLNSLLWRAKGDWAMVLDDDDLLDPNHLEVLSAAPAATVRYTRPRVEGGTFTQYDQPFDAGVLEHQNIVSHNALMDAEIVRGIGGWHGLRWFDWDLFRRLARAGADFLPIDAVTWTYRLHGANWSQGTLTGAP